MNFVKKIELAQLNLSRITGWINNSDSKVAIISVFQVGLIAFLINHINSIVKIIAAKTFGWPQFFLYFSIILFSFFLIKSIFKSFKSIYPDIEIRETSMFYFGSIAKQGQNKFVKEFEELKDEEILKQINSQVYINSQIAFNKFKSVKQSIKNLYVSVIFWIFTLVLIPIIIQ